MMDYLTKWWNRKFDEAEDEDRDLHYNARIMAAQTMLCLRKNKTVEQLINQLHNIRGEKLV